MPTPVAPEKIVVLYKKENVLEVFVRHLTRRHIMVVGFNDTP